MGEYYEFISKENKQIPYYKLTLYGHINNSTLRNYVTSITVRYFISKKKKEEKNVERFCGYCDEVVATTKESKFINPKNMVVRNKEGNITGYTDEYKSLLDFLKTELERYKEDGEDAAKIGGMRRRINALKAI